MLLISFVSWQANNIVTKFNIKRNQTTGAEAFYYIGIQLWFYSMIVLQFSKKDVLAIKPELHKALVIRVLSTGMCNSMLYVAFQFTAYTKASCIFQMNSLFLPYFCGLINKDKILKWDVIGIIGGLVGMLLVVQPFKEHTAHKAFWEDLVGCMIAFLACLLCALGVVYVQKLAKSGVHFTVSCFYFGVGSLFTSPLITYFKPRHVFPAYEGEFFVLVFVSALFFFLCMNCFIFAQKIISGATVGLLAFI